jgi:type IV secretory pathway protease TraF
VDKVAACGDDYYVLGDNSKDSDDSRFNGPVRRDEIVGRTWAILGPRARVGFINSRQGS